jgi:hypothetical protein
VRRVAVVLAAVLAAAGAAGAAGATNECRGLQVCVPVAGPWVLASSAAEVQFQLACPHRYIVAGLDAELSTRGIDIGFRGALGAPVNPGITTSTSAVFSARLVRRTNAAAFRPHIGCIPASGSGERYPTAFHPLPPAAPTMVELAVLPGTHRFVERCPAAKRLVSATHAIGFYTDAPPTAALARSVTVAQTVRRGSVRLTVRAEPLEAVRAIVQVDLVCVAAA